MTFLSVELHFVLFSFYLTLYVIAQAMHLVYKALEKYAIPSVLPPELMPLGKRKDIPKTKSPTPMGIAIAASPSPQSQPPPIPPLPNTTVVKNMTGLDVVKVFIF